MSNMKKRILITAIVISLFLVGGFVVSKKQDTKQDGRLIQTIQTEPAFKGIPQIDNRTEEEKAADEIKKQQIAEENAARAEAKAQAIAEAEANGTEVPAEFVDPIQPKQMIYGGVQDGTAFSGGVAQQPTADTPPPVTFDVVRTD